MFPAESELSEISCPWLAWVHRPAFGPRAIAGAVRHDDGGATRAGLQGMNLGSEFGVLTGGLTGST